MEFEISVVFEGLMNFSEIFGIVGVDGYDWCPYKPGH